MVLEAPFATPSDNNQVAHRQTKSFLAPSITPKQWFQFFLNFFLLATQIQEHDFSSEGLSMAKLNMTLLYLNCISKWI